jgi:hypothetical protein
MVDDGVLEAPPAVTLDVAEEPSSRADADAGATGAKNGSRHNGSDDPPSVAAARAPDGGRSDGEEVGEDGHETCCHAYVCGCGGQRAVADARQRVSSLLGFAISCLAFLPPLIVDQARGGEGVVTEVAPFFERDPMLSQKNLSSEVPSWLLFVVSLVVPGIGVPLTQRTLRWALDSGRPRANKRAAFMRAGWEALATLDPLALFLRFLTQYGWTMAITFMLKLYCGRLRPNFFASCDYQGYAETFDNNNNESEYLSLTTAGKFGDYGNCRFPNDDWRSAQKSFPSGHSSLAFSGLAWLGYYWSIMWRTLSHRGSWQREFAILPVAICLMGAFLIAGSRVRDNHHHYADILAGGCIGLAVATASFLLTVVLPGIVSPLTATFPRR